MKLSSDHCNLMPVEGFHIYSSLVYDGPHDAITPHDPMCVVSTCRGVTAMRSALALTVSKNSIGFLGVGHPSFCIYALK